MERNTFKFLEEEISFTRKKFAWKDTRIVEFVSLRFKKRRQQQLRRISKQIFIIIHEKGKKWICHLTLI